MNVQMIKDGSVLAFISRVELAERGIDTGGFTTEKARELLREALSHECRDADCEIDVDVYINGVGMMVFGILREPEAQAVEFSCFEDVLACVGADVTCAKRAMSLISLGNKYYLVFRGMPSPHMAEFGDIRKDTRALSAGRVLIADTAAAKLRQSFNL